MCYGCRPTCEDCKPKFVYCDECGTRNFLFKKACIKCGSTLTDEMKERDKARWKANKNTPKE